MSQDTKGYRKFELYENGKLGFEIQTYVSKSGSFMALISGKRIAKPGYIELTQALDAVMKDAIKLAWFPVIVVDEAHEGDNLGIKVDRCWMASQARTSKLWRVAWSIQAEYQLYGRRASGTSELYHKALKALTDGAPAVVDLAPPTSSVYAGEFDGKGLKPDHLPCAVKHQYSSKETIFLPYTPELWVALEVLQGRIKGAHTWLIQQLARPDKGLVQVAQYMTELLPAPDREEVGA